jgi:hypothetical protein
MAPTIDPPTKPRNQGAEHDNESHLASRTQRVIYAPPAAQFFKGDIPQHRSTVQVEEPMDPLSVTASVTGLFALTVQLIAAVDSIVRSVKSQPKTLQNILQELRALQLVLERLEKCVEPGTSLAVEDKALIAVLDGCTGTYQNIGSELSVLQAKLKENLAIRIYTQITFTSRMKALDALRDQLEKYKATLGIALQLRSL